VEVDEFVYVHHHIREACCVACLAIGSCWGLAVFKARAFASIIQSAGQVVVIKTSSHQLSRHETQFFISLCHGHNHCFIIGLHFSAFNVSDIKKLCFGCDTQVVLSSQ